MEELLISNLEAYGIIAVVAWMFIEEVVPVPSAIAPMAAAYVVVDATNPVQAFFMVFTVIAILGSAGSVLSSYLTYSLGFYGGKPGIEKFGKYIGINWRQVKSFEKFLTGGNEHLYIAGLRAIPLMPLSVISASAGFLRINWKRYGFWSFIGMVPRNLVLGMLGWYLKDDFTQAVTLLSQVSAVFLAVLGIALAILIVLFYSNESARNSIKEKYSAGKGLFDP